jgi:hypothetical protein
LLPLKPSAATITAVARKRFYCYAVQEGLLIGVYYTWTEVLEAISKFPGAIYRRFYHDEEAWEWIKLFDPQARGPYYSGIPAPPLSDSSLSQQFQSYPTSLPSPPLTPLIDECSKCKELEERIVKLEAQLQNDKNNK